MKIVSQMAPARPSRLRFHALTWSERSTPHGWPLLE